MSLREDANQIIRESIAAVLPGTNVRKLLGELTFGPGRLIVLSVGKAAYSMAEAAADVLKERISAGLIITKTGHMQAPIPGFEAIEAGHPLPDENSYRAADRAIELVSDLQAEDEVLFLLSGGASSLMEKPVIDAETYEKIMDGLLKSGADIQEINTVRKHLSYVKGGRLAEIIAPAHVHTVILSDVVGNDLAFVGSGPTYPDETTGEDAFRILEKYKIGVRADLIGTLVKETPKALKNVTYYRIGDVRMFVDAAEKTATKLGYQTVVLTDSLDSEAREAGAVLASVARKYQNTYSRIAFILGGETVVHVTGKGKGGRNQELALRAAKGIDGLVNTLIFSVSSDGTDGPTDAAGGIVDGDSVRALKKAGFEIDRVLEENDSYTALKAIGALVFTGPTGTNVNDISVLLIGKAPWNGIPE